MVSPHPPRYRAYLLRMWQEQTLTPGGVAVWRMMLEDPKTGQRRGFDGLESLLAYLRAEMGEIPGDDRKKLPDQEK